MRICVLTQNPRTYSNLELARALSTLGQVDVLNPLEQRISWPGPRESYDLTFNRVSSVEADSFLWTLMLGPHWGRQINSWDVRQSLWDKSRQALWLAQQGLPAIPFFMHRLSISEADEDWQRFAQTHQTPHGWVLKMNRGMKGVGVHFFDQTSELFRWLETLRRMNDQDFIIQPRCAPGPEYRLTLVGGKVWALVERENVDGPANFSQGGAARELKTVPPALVGLTQQLTRTPWCDVVSIDILMRPAGPVISDVNPVPGFEQLDQVTGRSLAVGLAEHVSKF